VDGVFKDVGADEEVRLSRIDSRLDTFSMIGFNLSSNCISISILLGGY